ncbi:unnamed protein product [Meloidogyne enterolobii]|uniref:Uncharacterized protein n=1 Tax=Meloidogyne enterolobii TaxID=390850 RepID=A0ACB0YW98_MELEN
MEKTADIPFQFNPRNTVLGRLIRYEVVRNNWSKDKGWGTKETSGGIPFEGGEKFILEFVAAPNNTIIVSSIRLYFSL